MIDHIPYSYRPLLSFVEMEQAAARNFETISLRRSIRQFSPEAFPRSILEDCIRAAGTAPSGAHQQPWHFVIVEDPDVKRRIREAAEKEERLFYSTRAPEEWLDALSDIGTDENKPFLETAPYLVVIFARNFGMKNNKRVKHYYVSESVGLAAGFFINAIHSAGLCTLTHTPSPMGFLSEVLGRPSNERPFLLLPVGFPADNAEVPDFSRCPLEEILTVI